MTRDAQAHWQAVYSSKSETDVSWFQESPAPSLDMIKIAGATPTSTLIDIGGGASRLVDELLARGFHDIGVLDLSQAALDVAKSRLGDAAKHVDWIVCDVTKWQPAKCYDLWHDRAAFHFLTQAEQKTDYIARMNEALKPDGHAIIATFALDGPEKCSGLPILRYDEASLAQVLGPAFELVETRKHSHLTPWGSEQRFQFSLFRRI